MINDTIYILYLPVASYLHGFAHKLAPCCFFFVGLYLRKNEVAEKSEEVLHFPNNLRNELIIFIIW